MDPIVIQLKSVTVFWTDLGLPKRLTCLQQDRLAEWWDDEVDPWITVAIKGDCNPHDTGVWFAEPRDAALFITRFWGEPLSIL